MIDPKLHLLDISRPLPEPEPSRHGLDRLDKNERNTAFSNDFLERLRSQVTSDLLSAYPEPWPIYERLSRLLGRGVDHLALNAGSEQSIKQVFETFIRPGDRVLLHLPCFAMYPVYADMFQAEVDSIHCDSNLDFDWQDFLNRITPGLRMVVVENPNGFLGTAPDMRIIESIVERAAECGTLALVDEAYHLFHTETAERLVDHFPNVIVSRSFSKAWGLAGLRAGYLVSAPETISALMRVKPAYEINAFTILVLRELLDDPREVHSHVTACKEQLHGLEASLTQRGYPCSDSKANFTTTRLGNALADRLRDALHDEGILIRRPFREHVLRDWIRISTAPQPVMDRLVQTLDGLRPS